MRNFIFAVFVILAVMSRFHSHHHRVAEGILSIPGTAAYEQELRSKTVGAWSRELIVDLKDGLSEDEIFSIEKNIGHELLAVSEFSYEPMRLMKIRLDHDDVSELQRIAALLVNDPRVEIVEDNFALVLPTNEYGFVLSDDVFKTDLKSPNDPLFQQQWHMSMIHVPEAWSVTQGDGVIVAVIDTGVTHSGKIVEDLAQAKFVAPYNFITKTTNANDDHGHGTHVACTIAEVSNNGLGGIGVAPKATIMPLKVLSAHGGGTIGDISAAIMYAADKGAKVINMSLGGPSFSRVLQNAVNYAHSKGVIVVCAAGNSGPREGTVGYPAGCKNAVAVSAVDAIGELTWYSSWGEQVAIAAPGGDLRADKNNDGKPDGVLQNTIIPRDPENMARYEMFQGTSMASPHVAGVAALVVSQGVTDPDKVLKVLQMSAVKKDNPKKYGAGVVDAYAAVLAAKNINCMDEVANNLGFPSILGSK